MPRDVRTLKRREGTPVYQQLDELNTEQVTIGDSPFLSDGDVLPIYANSANDSQRGVTTSTTFTNVNGLGLHWIQWNMFPTDATIVTGVSSRLSPGDGETITGRFYQTTDNEVVTPEISLSGESSQEWSGWGEYTPSTTDEPLFIRYEHKTSEGTNESESFAPHLWVGIKL